MYRNCPKIESWNTFKLDLKNIWHLSEIELYALEVFCQKSKGSRRKTFQWKQVLFVFGTEEVVLMQRIQSNKYTVIQLCAICFFFLIPFFCDMHLQAIQELQIVQFTNISSKHKLGKGISLWRSLILFYGSGPSIISHLKRNVNETFSICFPSWLQ